MAPARTGTIAPEPRKKGRWRASRVVTPAAFVLCVLIFYSVPLFSGRTSIQGDAADVHYPAQKYVADRWRTSLPFWTPYLYSGYPLLANPKTGAWYPLNFLYLRGT